MSEFLTIGEPIALFGSEEVDKSLKDACHVQKFLAGAEVNVAVGVSRLGHSSEYITQVGKDPFGEFIIDRLHENKIGTDYISETIALVKETQVFFTSARVRLPPILIKQY
jgi:2-dehydro-3-deoxygluconokinase